MPWCGLVLYLNRQAWPRRRWESSQRFAFGRSEGAIGVREGGLINVGVAIDELIVQAVYDPD